MARRMLAEDLVRRRRADDRSRYASAQRRALVDPNPHQIDAVVFALRRLPEGGCILADEVGLGKTIEAGLVVAQAMAEGMRRVLLVVPKPLVGQWQSELAALFGLEAREVDPARSPEGADGVWVVGREGAATERGQRWLGAQPWDLVVIDEAHELFANIWRRYGDGGYDVASDEAVTAHRVREVIGPAPVLLLTATPLQNSLVELWGLVQYVERTGTLLGDLSTFRALFCDADDATLVQAQAAELQRRIATVCQRTLRRQAQEFLEVPFVGRRCRLFEYEMSEAERSLYDDVSDWLLRPTLHAFAGRQRRLLLLGFHRRMASSLPALARALDGVAGRLRRLLQPDATPGDPADDDVEGLEPEEVPDDEPMESIAAAEEGTARAELAEVESYAARARALPHDSKARQFLEAVRRIGELAAKGQGSGKALVFTESLTTQEYLRDLLVAEGFSADDVTLFRGDNEGPRVDAALARWRDEAPLPADARPSREVAVRLALVHEFRTRSRVMVSTEAGAKGLNLQFCETVVNYDLPWNPQRIEQRIGRCHRYRQARDVTVVNFLAKGNEAHRLTFEILSRKLDLFGQVLDATDAVLHEPATDDPGAVAADVSLGFVADLARIYDRSRTRGERDAELAALGDLVGERRKAAEAERARTAGVLERTFDERVRRMFRGYQASLADGLRDLDAAVDALVGEPGPWSLSDPRVADSLVAARTWTGAPVALPAPDALRHRVGARGVLRVVRAGYAGFEPLETLVAGGALAGPDGGWTALDPATARVLAWGPVDDAAPDHAAADFEPALGASLDDALFDDQLGVEDEEQRHFERALSQLERYVEDRVTLRRRAKTTLERAQDGARARREKAVGATERARIDAELARVDEKLAQTRTELDDLVARRDERYLRWRADHHARRFAPPALDVLFTVPFVLTGGAA